MDASVLRGLNMPLLNTSAVNTIIQVADDNATLRAIREGAGCDVEPYTKNIERTTLLISLSFLLCFAFWRRPGVVDDIFDKNIANAGGTVKQGKPPLYQSAVIELSHDKIVDGQREPNVCSFAFRMKKENAIHQSITSTMKIPY